MSKELQKKNQTKTEIEVLLTEFEKKYEEAREKANKYLTAAVYSLLQSHAFIGHILQMLNRKIDMSVPTAAVGVINNKYTLFINPFFYSSLTIEEAIAILRHECYHLICDHLKRIKECDPNIWSIACLPAGELITGVNKCIELVSNNEMVLSSSGYTRVSNTMNRNYSGNLFTIKASGCLPIRVTDEHPIKVKERKQIKKYPIIFSKGEVWKEANKLREKVDYVLIPKLKGNTNIDKINLDEFIMHSSINRTEISNRCMIRELKVDNDLAWILGLYTAEGSRATKNNNSLDFSLSSKETNLHDNIKTYFSNLGYSVRCYIRNNSAKVTAQSTILSRAFEKWCGKGAHNKKIPDFILNHNDLSLVKSFIDGYIEGDGCYKKRDSFLSGTVSKTLALQLQLSYARMGKFASVRQSNRGERLLRGKILKPYTIFEIEYIPIHSSKRLFKNYTIKSTNHRWKDFGNYLGVPITSITSTPFNGRVYNLETESHEFAVSNLITHNCDMAINIFIPNLPKFDHKTAVEDGMKRHGLLEEDMKKHLPKPDMDGKCTSALLPRHFNMPDGRTAEWYYKTIMNDPKLRDKFKSKKILIKVYEPNEENNSGSKENPQSLKDQLDSGRAILDVQSDGDHNKWQQCQAHSQQLIDEELKRIIREAKDLAPKSFSTLPGDMVSTIQNFLKSKNNWKGVLRSWIQRATEVLRVNTRKRPSRRYGIIYPGQRSDFRLNLSVVADSSGSISDKDLALMGGEINRLFETKMANITVIVGDYVVQKVTKMTKLLTPKDFKFPGRGGTNAQPWLEEADKQNADAVIILTDGEFDYKLKRPKCLVLWALTTRGIEEENFKSRVPFGKVIKLSQEEKNG